MTCHFKNLKVREKYKCIKCVCPETLQIFGIREGCEFEVLSECLFGGTVLIKCNNCSFCVRKEEIEATLEKVE